MEAIALAVLTIAAAVWIGSIVFQSAIVAPTVFVNLDEGSARVFLRTLFPRLFVLGLLCGALMAASMLLVGLASGWTATSATILGSTLVMLFLGGLSLRMVPHINAARDAGEAGKPTFKRLHRTNVSMTMVVLLLGLAILSLIAYRALPGF